MIYTNGNIQTFICPGNMICYKLHWFLRKKIRKPYRRVNLNQHFISESKMLNIVCSKPSFIAWLILPNRGITHPHLSSLHNQPTLTHKSPPELCNFCLKKLIFGQLDWLSQFSYYILVRLVPGHWTLSTIIVSPFQQKLN